MGGQIPRLIKVEVLRASLEGKSRDQIAKEVRIGADTVSDIINEVRQWHLMRELAVKLKNKGYSIESFASAVRSRKILRRVLLDTPMTTAEGETREEEEDEVKTQQEAASKVEQKIESLIVALEVYCFKDNLSIKDFVDLVYELHSVADRLGVPLEKLPSYVKELENDMDRLKEEKQEALADHDLTSKVLDEYIADRPLVKTIQKLRQQIDTYMRDLEDERIGKMVDRELDSISMGISEEELDEANMKLGYDTTGGNGSNTHMVQELTPMQVGDSKYSRFIYPWPITVFADRMYHHSYSGSILYKDASALNLGKLISSFYQAV